jgi:hypothetical protein
MSGLDRLPLPVTVVVAQRALVDPAQPPWSARSSDQEPFPKTGHCPSWSRDRLPAWFGASHTAFPPGAESRTFQDAEKPQGGQEEQEKKITITLCIGLFLYFLLFLLSSLWFFCILPTRGMAGRCRPTPPCGAWARPVASILSSGLRGRLRRAHERSVGRPAVGLGAASSGPDWRSIRDVLSVARFASALVSRHQSPQSTLTS